jgi:hypothetical protein
MAAMVADGAAGGRYNAAHTMRLIFPIAILAVVLAGPGFVRADAPAAAAPAAEEAVKVEKAEVAVEYKRFDPHNLPDPPPPLNAGEAAVCLYNYGVQVDSRYSYAAAPATPKGESTKLEVKVERVSVQLSLSVTIWIPNDATEALKEHEEGHRRLAEHYYGSADAVVKGLAANAVGQKVSGEGKDLETAGRAAIDVVNQKLCRDYLASINGPCERAQEAFDRLTDHGRKARPTAEEAIGLALKEAAARK